MANDSFKKNFLDQHNSYRAEHGVDPMSYNNELCAIAQKWADELLKKNTFMHSNTEDGENIYFSQSSVPVTPTGKEAVDSWYSEIKDYNFSSPGFTSNTGHFTQVVWKNSTELGLGMATDGKTVFVVGQYRPAGNVNTTEHFQKNVLPKGKRTESGIFLHTADKTWQAECSGQYFNGDN